MQTDIKVVELSFNLFCIQTDEQQKLLYRISFFVIE
jgi:hypothetical protein